MYKRENMATTIPKMMPMKTGSGFRGAQNDAVTQIPANNRKKKLKVCSLPLLRVLEEFWVIMRGFCIELVVTLFPISKFLLSQSSKRNFRGVDFRTELKT